jgi:hypothetical protein
MQGILTETIHQWSDPVVDSPKLLFIVRCNTGNAAMALRIRMPGGTLKVKAYRELRGRERERRIPVMRLGSIYFVWWSNQEKQAGRKSNQPASR